MNLRSKIGAAFGAAATATVVAAAAAFACTNLATLNLSSSTGKVGDSVTVTGSSFRVATGTATTNPVVLRWNGADGQELGTVVPDRAGNISATFTVPQGEPGYYVVVATQRNAQGVDDYGTPARASYQILGATGPAAAPAASGATAGTSDTSSGMIALTVGLGVLGLALFGAGFAALVRQGRRRDVPVTAPVRRD